MKKKILKRCLALIGGLLVLVVAFVFWFMGLLPSGGRDQLKNTYPNEIAYLAENIISNRGKILAVVTSCDTMGVSGKKTGYELTELSRAYYVFLANGFEVDVASPLGGEPPVVIDGDDMGIYDYAFLNDSLAQHKTRYTIPLNEVKYADYQAIYFVGGKGAMFDFPQNTAIQAIVKDYYQSGKVIGAVCHGPAALLNVRLDDGTLMLEDKAISSFTNSEELFLIPDAPDIFPFLLQDKLVEQGARFKEGAMYLNQVAHDGNIVTGQNPWSTWQVAETMITQLGYQAKPRSITGEENAITLLKIYETEGYSSSKAAVKGIYERQGELDRVLLAMHSIVAAMQWDIIKSFNLIRLTRYVKHLDKL